METVSAGFRTNEAQCQLTYEAPYVGPEGDRPTVGLYRQSSILT